jgi:hypothetical protein
VISTIAGFLKIDKKSPCFLHVSARLYHFFRLLCCLIEEHCPGVSWRAGYKVSIGWTEELGES